MEERLIQGYRKITEGIIPEDYTSLQQQGQQIVKFSLLEATNFGYSNFTHLNTETTK